MSKYINFYAGDRTIEIGDIESYGKGDIGDLADSVTTGTGSISCPLEGAKAALEDGSYWQGSNVTAEALEEIHAAICEHEALA